MTISVWITRTEPGASRSAAAWRDAGFEPVVAPLLEVRPITHETGSARPFIPAFTSANAVRHAGIEPSGPALVIGDATGMAAREAGFEPIVLGRGDVKSMAQALVTAARDSKSLSQDVDIAETPVIHFSGVRLAGDLVDALRTGGLRAERVCVYETVPVEALPIFESPPTLLALYSPFAAETFMRLSPPAWSGLAACLSPAVAEPLRGRRVVVAEQPTQAALIAAVRQEMDAG